MIVNEKGKAIVGGGGSGATVAIRNKLQKKNLVGQLIKLGLETECGPERRLM